jgi:hypothetical protein
VNVTLLKSILALVPTSVLLAGSVRVAANRRTLAAALQLIGAACLVVLVLTHVAEALQILAWMRWGAEDSSGHYLDLASAILGLTLFPAGYALQAFAAQRP